MRYIVLIFSLFMSFAVSAGEKDLARSANDNPFLNGELNPSFEGQMTALAGEVIEIKPTQQKYPVYKLNLRIEGINSIWVTSIAPSPGSEIKIGDMIIFKGFISTAASLDQSGELEKLINSKSLLMAIQSQRPN